MDCQTSALFSRRTGRIDRSPLACDPERSKGRLVAEEPSPTRTDFQRDRDRIIHSTAFRRLKHKTQVFICHEGDHFRTRLTHTIEVAQIARALARTFRLDEDLAEALALAHDLGHTPFGHVGEEGLNAVMQAYGGFEHNAQTLRLVTQLERRYADFNGLNLTWETLEGIVKHNGPLLTDAGQVTSRYRERGVPAAILDYNQRHDLALSRHASLEAQAAAIADDIAYNTHDIDDALRGGVLTLDDLICVPVVGTLVAEIRRDYPSLDPGRAAHELVRRVMRAMIEDVIRTVGLRLEEARFSSQLAVCEAGETVITFSPSFQKAEKEIKTFLSENVYHTPYMIQIGKGAKQIVCDLFQFYFVHPDKMSDDWANDSVTFSADEHAKARQVCDYVAGMTDRFAVKQHKTWFDHTPQLS